MFSGYENLDYSELIILISQFPTKTESDKNLLEKTFDSLGVLIENQLVVPVVIQASDWYITENPLEINDENYSSTFIAGLFWNKKTLRSVDHTEVVEYLKQNKLPYFEHHYNKLDRYKNFNKYFNLNKEFYDQHLKYLVKTAIRSWREKDAYGINHAKTIMKTARKLKKDWEEQCSQKKN